MNSHYSATKAKTDKTKALVSVNRKAQNHPKILNCLTYNSRRFACTGLPKCRAEYSCKCGQRGRFGLAFLSRVRQRAPGPSAPRSCRLRTGRQAKRSRGVSKRRLRRLGRKERGWRVSSFSCGSPKVYVHKSGTMRYLVLDSAL